MGHLLFAVALTLTLLPGSAGQQGVSPETPGPRWGHVLVWNPASEHVLLFGGSRARGEYLDDTWTWDGERWQRHEVEGPAARGFAAAAYHEARGTVVLHGGRAEGRRPHTDTWEWDGAGWALVDEGAFAADHHGMVYLPESEELLAFGGWNGTGVSGETWRFGERWERLDDPGPPPRSAFGMGYDAERGVAVVCGGLWLDGQYADVWEFTGGAWRSASGPYDNSSLDHHSLVWDPVRRKLVGFGGKNYRYRPLDRTFEVSGGRFPALATGGPAPRHSTPLAWDGVNERVLLYGGKEYAGEDMLPLGDAWHWDGRGWASVER